MIGNIGSGSFGTVFSARLRGDTRPLSLAIKRVPGLSIETLREAAALKTLGDHPHIVKCVAIGCDDDDIVVPKNKSDASSIYFVLELAHSTLYKTLHSYPQTKMAILMQEQDVWIGVTKQLLVGIQYIHANRLMHRDLKPENLLLFDHPWRTNFRNTCPITLKIADFGATRKVTNEPCTPNLQTLSFRSPECLWNTKIYDEKCDIWSFGCILYELVVEQAMFGFVTTDDQLKIAILSEFGCLFEDTKGMFLSTTTTATHLKGLRMARILHPLAREVIEWCCKINPIERPSATQLLGHQLFQSY